MAEPKGSGPKITGQSPLDDVLLGRAIQGDPEAAHWLVTLLGSEYHDRITGRMKKLHTGAHTGTIEDVFQDTLIQFMDGLKAGALKDLPDEHRQDILKYFQRLCDGRLHDAVRPRLNPALSRKKEEPSEDLVDKNVRIPGDARHTEHLELVNSAMARLEPDQARILKRYLDGVPYAELSREMGRSEEALRMLVGRAKKALQDDIVPRSATAKLKFEQEQAKTRRWPRRSEIETAISVLPPEIKDAAVFVHIQHGTVENLARKLGSRGLEKAQARLEQAYQSLSGRMKVPFPEAFEQAQP